MLAVQEIKLVFSQITAVNKNLIMLMVNVFIHLKS